MVERHPALRTEIVDDNGVPLQRVAQSGDIVGVVQRLVG